MNIHITVTEEELGALKRFARNETGTLVDCLWDQGVARGVVQRLLVEGSKCLDGPDLLTNPQCASPGPFGEAGRPPAPEPEVLLYARCARHFAVPQLNRNEWSGAECGACIAEAPSGAATNCYTCPECGEKTNHCARCHERKGLHE